LNIQSSAGAKLHRTGDLLENLKIYIRIMGNLRKLLFIGLIITVFIRCTDNLKNLEIDINSGLVSDSIVFMPDTILNATADNDTAKILTGKYIYLTIDDAPLNGSAYLDSIIRAEKIKTNIFLVGNPIHGSARFKKYHEKLEQNPFIEIYNHSYSHANNRYADYYKDSQAVVDDFEKNQLDFNIQHKIARLPGRNFWQVGEKKKNHRQSGAEAGVLLADNGYKVFGWDVEWNYEPKDYAPEQSIDELVEKIEKMFDSRLLFTSGHVVLLMHDQMFTKVNDKNNLSELINRLKEKDYIFEYLTSYPELQADYRQ